MMCSVGNSLSFSMQCTGVHLRSNTCYSDALYTVKASFPVDV